jgi:dienelactone hydrolase
MATTRDVEYQADGRSMIGRLGIPDGDGLRPAVLICHEGPGLDEFQKRRALQFAEMGYVAFALDYHGGGKPLPDRDAMMARIGELRQEPSRIRGLAQAGLDVLLAEPLADPARVAAIGYCFGGTMVLELARGGADVKAVVGFHAGLGTTRPDDAANITARVLVCIGADDPLVPMQQRIDFEEEMRAGNVDWRMNLYGGAQHSFTNPAADGTSAFPGVQYHQLTDERSWRAMLDLFDEAFAPG